MLKPVNLPQNPESAYDRRLSIMLYEYLRDIQNAVNSMDRRVSEIEDSMSYATRYDQDSSTPTFAYLGKASAGSATSAAVWQIQKLDFGVDGDVTVTWADGNARFDNVWDNRASLSYS